MDTVVCVCVGGGKGERVNECVCVQLYVCRWEEGGGRVKPCMKNGGRYVII